MTVEILSLSARGEDVSVTFEIRSGEHCQRESFLVPVSMVADLRLRIGMCTPSCYDAVSWGAERAAAIKRGVYLLGFGNCSKKSLTQKLIHKGYSVEIAQEAVAELEERGYLNEGADAAREAEKCVAKLWGERRIAAALMAKGFTQECTSAALYALEDQGVDFVELCAERIRRTEGRVPEELDKRHRLMASLQRNGFSTSDIREAFRLLTEES